MFNFELGEIMESNLKVSIIIPFQKENDYLIETIYHIDKLNYKNIEVMLLPDFDITQKFIDTNLKDISFEYQIIPTDAVSPAIKRDIGADKCTGEILAFIDDDAYPAKDWLNKALPHFNSKFKIRETPQERGPNSKFKITTISSYIYR